MNCWSYVWILAAVYKTCHCWGWPDEWHHTEYYGDALIGYNNWNVIDNDVSIEGMIPEGSLFKNGY